MIITKCDVVRSHDLSEYAWAGLRRFHNTPFVTDRICRIQRVPEKHQKNAEKQATQIRYCLQQAREYYDAASVVTLATQPNLYYYSMMSLALAEVLFKQDGTSSLDKAREHHKHHGLELRTNSLPKDRRELADTAAALRAVPLCDSHGNGFGTFELWHRTAREMPLVGEKTVLRGPLKEVGADILFGALDARLQRISTTGLSLLDCLRALPGMINFLRQHGVAPRTMRARLEGQWEDGAPPEKREFTLWIHPGDPGLISEFLGNLLFDPNAIDAIEYRELPNGGRAKWTGRVLKATIPHVTSWNEKDVYFWPSAEPLNEFGYFYVALYIVGNYARYFPDHWLHDVENSTPLALAVEELIRVAKFRVPLLALSEFSSCYQIPDT